MKGYALESHLVQTQNASVHLCGTTTLFYGFAVRATPSQVPDLWHKPIQAARYR